MNGHPWRLDDLRRSPPWLPNDALSTARLSRSRLRTLTSKGLKGHHIGIFGGRSRAKPTRFDVVEPLIMIYSGLMVISWSWNWISIFVECRVVKVGSSPWGFSQFNQNKNFQRATLMDFIENPGCRTKNAKQPYSEWSQYPVWFPWLDEMGSSSRNVLFSV